LFGLGYGAWRESEARLVHHTPCTTPRRLAEHHFIRGRGLAQVLVAERLPRESRALLRMIRTYVLLYIPGRWWRTTRNVRQWGDADLRWQWRRASLLAVLALTASWIGMWYELLRVARERMATLFSSAGPARHPPRQR
jgi:hypothetical protein